MPSDRWKNRWNYDKDRTIEKEQDDFKKTDESKMSDEELLKSAWGDYYKVKKRKQNE
jgi:hypothetical protein